MTTPKKKKAPKRSPKQRPKLSAVERYRERMRRSGMRLVQIWLPDPRAPGFREECRRQVAVVARRHEHEREVMEFIEGLQDTRGWTW